jgi:hypothetical protein
VILILGLYMLWRKNRYIIDLFKQLVSEPLFLFFMAVINLVLEYFLSKKLL